MLTFFLLFYFYFLLFLNSRNWRGLKSQVLPASIFHPKYSLGLKAFSFFFFFPFCCTRVFSLLDNLLSAGNQLFLLCGRLMVIVYEKIMWNCQYTGSSMAQAYLSGMAQGRSLNLQVVVSHPCPQALLTLQKKKKNDVELF